MYDGNNHRSSSGIGVYQTASVKLKKMLERLGYQNIHLCPDTQFTPDRWDPKGTCVVIPGEAASLLEGRLCVQREGESFPPAVRLQTFIEEGGSALLFAGAAYAKH